MKAYKKFATQYRPFMFKLKEEVCNLLSMKNHVLLQLYGTETAHFGNLLDPCPIYVIVKYVLSNSCTNKTFLGAQIHYA